MNVRVIICIRTCTRKIDSISLCDLIGPSTRRLIGIKHQDGRGGRRRLADGEDRVYVPVVSMSCLLLSNWTLGRSL